MGWQDRGPAKREEVGAGGECRNRYRRQRPLLAMTAWDGERDGCAPAGGASAVELPKQPEREDGGRGVRTPRFPPEAGKATGRQRPLLAMTAWDGERDGCAPAGGASAVELPKQPEREDGGRGVRTPRFPPEAGKATGRQRPPLAMTAGDGGRNRLRSCRRGFGSRTTEATKMTVGRSGEARPRGDSSRALR